MSRKALKIPAADVPQTREDADRLLGEIGGLQRQIEAIDAALTDEVAALKADAAARAKPFADQLTAKFGLLAVWAESRREELIPGKLRSVTLSQGKIGWRWGTPAVKLARGIKEETIVAVLERLGLGGLLRQTIMLDRQAILREPERIDGIAGVAVEQTESFFAKPLEVSSEVVKTVSRLKGADANRPADAEDSDQREAA